MLKSRFSTNNTTSDKRTSAPVPVQIAKHVSLPVSLASTALTGTDTITNTESLGSIVAFEGHPETISTQLRLLPTSPQILILPGVQCYLPIEDDQQHFEPHEYIRKAHDAVKARNETARAFLQGSQPDSKRLVFLNGGTPSAQALCIRQIMRHETQGDDLEAEAMFNFLVRDGLGGLDSQSKKWFRKDFVTTEPSPKTKAQSPRQKQQAQQKPMSPEQPDEDPITRAMRAAEALDRSTANLQPSNELDLTLTGATSRPRSYSLPMYGYSDNYGDAAPFFVFGARKRANSDASIEEAVEEASVPPMTPRFAVTHYEEGNIDEPILTAYTDPDLEKSPACVGETYGPTFLHSPLVDALPTSRSDVFEVRSPSEVTFGEASLVDMRTTPTRGPVTRVRSLDRIYPASSKMRDLCIPPDVAEDDSEVPRRPHSCMMIRKDSDTATTPTPIEGPRTILVRSKQSSVVSLKSVPAGKKRKNRSSYVDRGTDAEVVEEKKEPFAPILPLTEDLVVYFKDEIPDALLDNVIKSFRDGSYPVLSNSPEGSDTDTVTDQLPTTPKSQSLHEGQRTPKTAENEEPAVASPSIEVDEYDPFAYVQTSWPAAKSAKSPEKVKTAQPPTPEKTPEPSVVDNRDDKFHEFKVASSHTAVVVQNSLRSVLEVHFPLEAQGYRQFSFALLPELEGLWKPIFREAEPGSPRANNRRMDQILAIGSQKGVTKEYSSAIVGLLDKLGNKKSGMSRSGRLDFRYLLANAMQAFTAQPLTNQTSDNPFNNSYLLATLIVPHLETYLALHSEVRYLLLEYPPEHLSTILALQKLVGVDLMKVAQIVDSKKTDMGPFTHIRGASINSQSAKQGQSPLGKPVGLGTAADIIVSKANFLLTSSASDTEIATFIATVRKILMEVSQFYTPEESLQPPPPPKKLTPSVTSATANKNRPKPLSGNFSGFPKPSGPLSPTTPSPTNTITPYKSLSPQPSTRAASIAETVRTFRTGRTGKSTKKSRRKRPPTAGEDGQSVFTYDPSADSDYDDEERRLMPIFLARHHRRPKPNSRKALKFLGLA